jgi:hypothetical protein
VSTESKSSSIWYAGLADRPPERARCRVTKGAAGTAARADMVGYTGAYDAGMGLIIALLVIWLVLSIVGFAVKGLIWLAIIGLVLFVATGVWGWVKRKAKA